MFTRKIVRIPFVAALFAVMLFSPGRPADAQSRTGDVVSCVDKAADKLKECTDALPWYAEVLCYARYASDGVLCIPAGMI